MKNVQSYARFVHPSGHRSILESNLMHTHMSALPGSPECLLWKCGFNTLKSESRSRLCYISLSWSQEKLCMKVLLNHNWHCFHVLQNTIGLLHAQHHLDWEEFPGVCWFPSVHTCTKIWRLFLYISMCFVLYLLPLLCYGSPKSQTIMAYYPVYINNSVKTVN